MKISIYSGLLVFLFLLFTVSCQNKGNQSKTEPVDSDAMTAEIEKVLPENTQEIEHAGKAIYDKYCLTCHKADGQGVPNVHPPLGPGSWVEREPKVLVSIMLKGLNGKIEVNGVTYNGYMPSMANLSDQEMADVLSYVRSSFGNQLEPITVDMVKKIKSGK